MTTLPNTFYRYRSLRTEVERNRVRALLVEGKTYIPAFDQFRDQDESLFTADFNGSLKEKEDHRFRLLRLRHPSKPVVELLNRAKFDARHYAPQTDEDNEKFQQVLLEHVMHSVGMLCLSEDQDNDVMWQRYGDNHSGIAIGLRWMMADEYVEETPLEVVYDDKLPHLHYFTSSPSQSVQTVLQTKPTRWKDESEWRLIFTDRPPNQVIQLRAWFPVELVLGRKISDENMTLVQQWRLECSTRPKIKIL